MPWPVMDEAAYHGLAGDFVRTMLPHTEADAAGLLMQFLVAFGSVISNSPYYLVESDKHHANLYLVLVGHSSRGRKGTGAGRVRESSRTADEMWANGRNVSGLSSGEGLISHVRDEVRKWNAKVQCDEIADPGVGDKRLMVTEAEFAGTLTVMGRLLQQPVAGHSQCLGRSPIADDDEKLAAEGHGRAHLHRRPHHQG